MKLKCNDGKVRRFYPSHTDGQRMPSGYRASGSAEAECEECHEKFGVHDLKILKPVFKAHVCPPKRILKTAIWYDPFGSMSETPEQQIANDVRRLPRDLFNDRVTFDWYCVNGPHEIKPRTELVLFDFGGMSLGNDLMASNSRYLLQWAQDNPNTLILVTSGFTYDHGVDYELRALGFATLPNVINLYPLNLPDAWSLLIPKWFLNEETAPVPVKGGICERCHRRLDDEIAAGDGEFRECRKCGEKVCNGCMVTDGKKAGLCGTCAGW